MKPKEYIYAFLKIVEKAKTRNSSSRMSNEQLEDFLEDVNKRYLGYHKGEN